MWASWAAQVAAAGGSGGEGLIDRWRDLGPTIWVVAGAGAAVWLLMLGVFVLATRPRNVEAGPTTLEFGGPEPPAIVNLITGDWRLGREAVPATLLDLAARRLLAIEQVGDRTLVRIPPPSEARREGAANLEPYERMVLEHVRHLATDGVVPADALTTGPQDKARGWWRKFRRSVERDANQRSLSRRRWSPFIHLTLTVAALGVAALVAIAATTLPDDPDDSDDDPVGRSIAFGAVTALGLMAAVEALNGQRDTRPGRAAAGRWLGLRTLLAEDPLFAEYPPAGVAIWDRLLSYGAAMGVAHGAVRAIPLGTESDREAWSSVGGRWRVVRIRYPRFFPPGYGRHPGLAVAIGVFQLALAALAFPVVTSAVPALLDAAADFSSDKTVPTGFRASMTIMLAAVVAIGIGLAVRGGLMLGAGLSDLLASRRGVEGRVLRVRRRGSDEHVRWYVAVDDGSTDRIRAWRTSPGPAVQGAIARASVTRWLANVRDLEVMAAAPSPAYIADVEDEDDLSSPLSALLGTMGTSSDSSMPGAPAVPLPAPAGPPPPLPTPAAVSAVVGRSLEVDPAARPHPLAPSGASATFVGDDGSTVQIAWVDPNLLMPYRSMPRLLRRELPGVGDEAYRAVIGGGVVARRAGRVLLVTGRLRGRDDSERDAVFEQIARATLA